MAFMELKEHIQTTSVYFKFLIMELDQKIIEDIKQYQKIVRTNQIRQNYLDKSIEIEDIKKFYHL